MTRIAKLYGQLRDDNRQLTFSEFIKLLEAFQFEHKRTSGSHRIFAREGIAEQMSIQPDGKDAKPYQVRAFLAIVDEYGWTLDDDE